MNRKQNESVNVFSHQTSLLRGKTITRNLANNFLTLNVLNVVIFDQLFSCFDLYVISKVKKYNLIKAFIFHFSNGF